MCILGKMKHVVKYDVYLYILLVGSIYVTWTFILWTMYPFKFSDSPLSQHRCSGISHHAPLQTRKQKRRSDIIYPTFPKHRGSIIMPLARAHGPGPRAGPSSRPMSMAGTLFKRSRRVSWKNDISLSE